MFQKINRQLTYWHLPNTFATVVPQMHINVVMLQQLQLNLQIPHHRKTSLAILEPLRRWFAAVLA